MKSLIRSLVILAAAPVAAFAINTYNVYTDVSGTIQFYQPGGAVEFTDSYVFEVGVFTPGTDFSATNGAGIAASFKSFGAPTNWGSDLIDVGVGGASLSFSFDDVSNLYPNGIVANNQLAIWAYDSKNIASSSDWVILTNPSWVVQPLAVGAAVDSRDYTITDSGTVALFGSIGSTKATSVNLVTVPEPSTYAALAGVMVLGAVATRRRRSA